MATRNVFTVFEDNDGICVVPSKWLSPNKRNCKWPGHLKYGQINKMIVNEKDADNNWDVVTVKQIFTTAATYEAAATKAKDAEFITDVDDEEKLKKSRHDRKRIIVSSSSDTDEEVSRSKNARKEVVLKQFPKAPKVSNTQNDLTTKDNLIRSNFVNNTAASVSSIVKSDVQTCSDADTTRGNENSVPSDQGINQVLRDNDDIPKNVSTYKFLTLDEKLNYLCESNALIMKKLNRIILEKSIQTHCQCNDTSECSMREIKNSKDSLINDYFPLKNINAVKEFEKLLQDKKFTVSEVAQTLLKRGGKKMEGFLNHIMQDLFVDEVAVQYSYKGQGEKKKNSFKNLLLKECVFKAAYLFSSSATDENIKRQISIWLAGATLRLKRKTPDVRAVDCTQ